MPAYLLPSSA